MAIAYKYVGRGRFLMGLPARDIKEDEVKRFQALLETPAAQELYEPVTPAGKSKKTQAPEPAAPAEQKDVEADK